MPAHRTGSVRAFEGAGHAEGSIVLSAVASKDGALLATAADDKKICVWDTSLFSCIGSRDARAVSCMTFASLNLPGATEPVELLFWGDRSGNVSCAAPRALSSGSRVLLGHTGAAIAELCVLGSTLFSADTDETIRASALPFGHRILGNILGHTGSIQQLIPVRPHGSSLATRILSISADATVKVSDVAAPVFATLSEPLRLEGAVTPVLEFVGGPLSDITPAVGALPSRDEAAAAFAAGVEVCLEGVAMKRGLILRQLKHGGTPDVPTVSTSSSSTAAEATAGASDVAGAGADEPIPPATATVVSASGEHMTSVRPVQVLTPRRGIFDGGFVCSAAVQCPMSGVVLLALTSPPVVAARAADGPESVRALRTIAGKALEARKRAQPGDDSDVISKSQRKLSQQQVRLPADVMPGLLPEAEHKRFCILRLNDTPASSSAGGATAPSMPQLSISVTECAIPDASRLASSTLAAPPARWPQIAMLSDDSFIVDAVDGTLLPLQVHGGTEVVAAAARSQAGIAAAAINAFLAVLPACEDMRVERAWSDRMESGTQFWRS